MNEKFSKEKNPNQLRYISFLWEINSLTRNQTNLFVCMVFLLLSLLRIFTQKEMRLLPVKGYNSDPYLAHKVTKFRSKASLVYATNTWHIWSSSRFQDIHTWCPTYGSETMLISLLTIYICCVAPAVRANWKRVFWGKYG